MNELEDKKDNQKMDTENPDEAASPCVGVCLVNLERTCTGCGRTLDEIGDWSSLTNEQRSLVNDRARTRMQNLLDAK